MVNAISLSEYIFASHRLNTTLSPRENVEFLCVSLLPDYTSKCLTNPALESDRQQNFIRARVASSACIASSMNGLWMVSCSHRLPWHSMECTLLSGGYSEHRLPAAICEDGPSQLHHLSLPLNCHCNEYFSQFLEPGLSNWVSNSGNSKEVVTGLVVSQVWQRVNIHQHIYCYECLYLLHRRGLPVTTGHSHYLPSKSSVALVCCVEICLVPNNFQYSSERMDRR